jgi:hypothetical protein
MCHKVLAVHFGIILKFVDNIEAARVPHDGEHEFWLWMSGLGFMIASSLTKVHIRRGNVLKKYHDSSLATNYCHPSRSAAYKKRNIAFAYSFRFSHNLSVNTCRTQCKWNNLKQGTDVNAIILLSD